MQNILLLVVSLPCIHCGRHVFREECICCATKPLRRNSDADQQPDPGPLWGPSLVPRPLSTPIARFCILMRWRLLRGQNVSSEPKVGTKCPHLLYWDQWLVKMAEFSWASKMFIDLYQIEFILRQVGLKFCGFNIYWIEAVVHKLTYWKVM